MVKSVFPTYYSNPECCSLQKDEGNLTLRNLSFDAVGPKLFAVVGNVGSGKVSTPY